MPSQIVYIKCDRNRKCNKEDVFLKDLGEVFCADQAALARIRSIKVYHFTDRDNDYVVISALRLIELVRECCPESRVEMLGEPDVIVERVKRKQEKSWLSYGKILFVCLISFFGTAFTIMAYHNDIGIHAVFAEIYRLCMGKEIGALNTLEVSYSIGLASGIVLFFNHVGGKRLTKDPTPIEVSMRNYEKDVDQAMIENASRCGSEESAG